MAQRWGFPKPAEGLGGGTVVQGSTACLVRLVDLSASVHQGHGALIPPISSRIVQRCPLRRNQEGERFRVMEITCWNKIQSKLKSKKNNETLTFPSSPSYSSRYHYLRASSDIQHFCEERGFKKKKTRFELWLKHNTKLGFVFKQANYLIRLKTNLLNSGCLSLLTVLTTVLFKSDIFLWHSLLWDIAGSH